jgi:Protein of unknown function (DUF3800)
VGLVSLVRMFDGRPVVRAIFSDESTASGNGSQITVVAGILLNLDTQCDPLIQDIETALADAFGSEGRSTDWEIKGSQLAKALRNGRKKDDAKAALTGILPLTFAHQFRVFYGAVDHAGFEKTRPYYDGLRKEFKRIWPTGVRSDLAFAECLMRVNRYVSKCAPKEKVLWIHDNAGSMTIAKYVELQLQRTIAVSQMYLNHEKGVKEIKFGSGKAGITLNTPNIRIADTIFFGDSASSRLLQFADLCCSVIAAHLLVAHGYVEASNKDVILASYYPLIQDSVDNDGVAPLLSRARLGYPNRRSNERKDKS